jgi:hypothetical protein
VLTLPANAPVAANAALRRTRSPPYVGTCQGAIRAVIAGSITRPDVAAGRPGHRSGLIEHALAPFAATVADPGALDQLKRDLAIVMCAEALFTLTDLCGLAPDDPVAGAVHTARTLTAAAVQASR